MSPRRNKKTRLLCLFLLKRESHGSLDGFLKDIGAVTRVGIKDSFSIDGYIYYPSTQSTEPRWQVDINELSVSPIDLDMNSSNKAVLITKVDEEVIAMTFGYGRSLLKEEDIERNFGLKVALSTVDPSKIRSINTATYEDMVVTSQRQANEHTSQDEFGLDTVSDILRGVTGVPTERAYGKSISGKDMLKVSIEMDLAELYNKFHLFIQAYRSDRYKENFEWIDNINDVRDKVLAEYLDGILVKKLESGDTDDISISPPDTIDWDNIDGIYLTGTGRNNRNPEQTIDVYRYISESRTMTLSKLKRDRLMVRMSDGSEYTASSVYNSIVTEVDHEDNRYILCLGKWYHIHENFFEKVMTFLNETIPLSDIELPKCKPNIKEEDYNKEVVHGNDDYCLLDQVFFNVEDGPKQIEACDIFTKKHQFVHVKMKTRSSLLSHLFSQGRVSYECFVSDRRFRESIAEKVNSEIGNEVIDPHVDIIGYEVIFAIITAKQGQPSEIIPFFSAVTLMQSYKFLAMIGAKCSICIIPYK